MFNKVAFIALRWEIPALFSGFLRVNTLAVHNSSTRLYNQQIYVCLLCVKTKGYSYKLERVKVQPLWSFPSLRRERTSKQIR